MKEWKEVVFLATVFLFCAKAHTLPEELLANPFGGRPPEFSPGVPEETPIGYRYQSWEGAFLGYRRSIGITSEFFSGDNAEHWIIVNSRRGDELCMTETSLSSGITKARVHIPPQVGGCWRDNGNEQYSDLGGAEYGPISCSLVPDSRKGSCVYTSISTGRKHRFSVVASDYAEDGRVD